MDILETVQQRAKKMMKGLKHLFSEERQRELGQLSLDNRIFPTVNASCSCLLWVSCIDKFRKHTFGESSSVWQCHTCVSLPGLPVHCKLLHDFIEYKNIHSVFPSQKDTANLQQIQQSSKLVKQVFHISFLPFTTLSHI